MNNSQKNNNSNDARLFTNDVIKIHHVYLIKICGSELAIKLQEKSFAFEKTWQYDVIYEKTSMSQHFLKYFTHFVSFMMLRFRFRHSLSNLQSQYLSTKMSPSITVNARYITVSSIDTSLGALFWWAVIVTAPFVCRTST